MSWLRANWLDALIFLLFALVVAGLVFFLLGINPFARPSPSLVNQPVPSPSVQTQSQSSSTSSSSALKASSAVPKVTAKTMARSNQSSVPKSTEKTPVVTVIPLPQSLSSSSAPAQPAQPSRSSPVASAPTSSAPRVSAQPSISATQGDWAVAVGAFARLSDAHRLADHLRHLGYTVHFRPAGNLTRVLVGPYPTRQFALLKARVLKAYGAQVVQFKSSAPAQATYIQVGAFARTQDALALKDRLSRKGFPVVLVQSSKLILVRVGPVSDPAQTASQLRALGLPTLEVP
jgi:cell division septation protein DedD